MKRPRPCKGRGLTRGTTLVPRSSGRSMAITAPTVQPYPVYPAPSPSFPRKRESTRVNHEARFQAGCSGASSRASLRRAPTIPGSLRPMRPLLLPVSADCISCPSTLARMAGRRQGDRQAPEPSTTSKALPASSRTSSGAGAAMGLPGPKMAPAARSSLFTQSHPSLRAEGRPEGRQK